MGELRVVALSGSLRTGSWNTKLLQVAVPALEKKGVTVDVFDLRAAHVPIYDPDVHDTNPPPGLADFKKRIRAAQGLMLVSPEYNFSIPGVVKNLIDAASRPPAENPFRGKVTVQLGATTGMGGTLLGQAHIRHVLSGLQCFPLPGAFTISKAQDQFDEQGQLKDEAFKKQLDGLLERFVAELKLRNP